MKTKKKTKDETILPARQGDVLVRRVDKLPEDVKLRSTGNLVLAEGEVTGHAHRIVERAAEMWDGSGGKVYVTLPVEALITHEEHAQIPMPPGTYEVIRQCEYSRAEVRQVAD